MVVYAILQSFMISFVIGSSPMLVFWCDAIIQDGSEVFVSIKPGSEDLCCNIQFVKAIDNLNHRFGGIHLVILMTGAVTSNTTRAFILS